MFNLFKKKPKQVPDLSLPRGILPTQVTDDAIVLCKMSPTIRNTYEIRLALYFAAQDSKQFVLAVRPGSYVPSDLREHLEQNGGKVKEMDFETYAIYIGHQDAQGSEGDGWVFGDSEAWQSFQGTLKSQWLKQHLVVGASFEGAALSKLEEEIESEVISNSNVDNENVKEALIALISTATQQGGDVFVQ